MKRIMMVGAILLLSATAARAQGLDLPEVSAKPADAKKPSPKGDALDLPPLDAKPATDAAKAAAKSDALDLPALDAKPAAKPAGKDAKAAKPAKDALDLGALDAKPAAKEAQKELAKDAAKEVAKDASKEVAKDASKDKAAGPGGLDGLQAKDAPKDAKDVKKEAPKAVGAAPKALAGDKVTPELKDKAGAASPATGMTARAVPAREEKGPWSVALLAGAERGGERYLDGNTSLTRLGLSGGWNFSGGWALLGAFDFRSSAQGYVINRPSDSGEPRSPVLLDEQRYDFRLALGFDAGPKITGNKRLLLRPSLGLRTLTLQNEAFPTSFFGLEAGVESSWELSRAVTVQGALDYAYNFTESSTQSAVGAPKTHFGWSAGLKLPLDGGFALEFNYVGDLLAFRNVYRVAHGASLGFSTTF